MVSPPPTPVEKGSDRPVDVLPSDASTSLEKELEENPNAASQPPENAPESEQDEADTGEETETNNYITGARLFAVMASMTLVAFLMLLDMSIVATVCR